MTELKDLAGVGPATVTKLEESGLGTLMSLAVSSPTEVSTVAGMSESVARKIIKAARAELQLGFEKAKDFAKKREKINKIGTGCSDFDEVLDGGFESSTITEVYGRTAGGKTQMSHLMVVRALMEDSENKAIYLDSESTFRPSRIKDFCEANKLDYDNAMERIMVARSFNTDHQMLLVDTIEKMLQEDNTYRILVVDSLTSHFRADFSGRGELAPRQQKLNKHLHQLLKIADLYNLVVIVTNQVQSDPGQFYGNPEKPIGGNILSHSVTSIIAVRPGKKVDGKPTWNMKLVDSPCLPVGEADYRITKSGFENV